MSKIQVLDSTTAAKIAAGEVIERPSGVLKELLENAIDAGATAIRVDIEGSGKELIRINDNGCGMDEADLTACVLRHATSKIHAFADLEKLQTFGFRGEALYSVAAVSRMMLTSCTGEGSGHTLEIHAGQVLSQRPAPAIKGTTVQIRDLFYNTPARLKFLKSDSYERACLLKVVEESALANLTVSYRVYINGREVYNLPAQSGPLPEAVRARAKDILGEEVATGLVYHSFEQMGLQLFLTPIEKLVNVRDMQYVFVNRRPIDSKTVSQAIYKAYQNARPKDRHPAFIAYMTLAPNEFDVNVHPQKREIRFVNENQVFGFMMHAAGETVFSHSRPVEAKPTPAITLPEKAQAAAELLLCTSPQKGPVPTEVRWPQKDTTGFNLWTKKPVDGLRETLTPAQIVPVVSQPEKGQADVQNLLPEEPVVLSPKTVTALPQEKTPEWFVGPYHYLGQLHRTYLLFENPDGLVLIDQHAAQERVLFEHYLTAFEQHQIAVQKLLFPLQVDLLPSNVEMLLSWGGWLKTAGFEISPFSAHTVTVHTRPHIIRFKENDLKEFIVSLSQLVGDPTKSTETLKRKMIAMLACKKAIKAHDAISAAEAEGLVESMKKCKDGMHCPHGRPCVAQIALTDIAKLFGR